MAQKYSWSNDMRSQAHAAELEIMKEYASQDVSGAQRVVGWMYEYGYGTECNPTEAVKWYELAALQGDILSMHSLGLMFSCQNNYVFDIDKALHWYTVAANRGDADAQFMLAYLLLDTEESKRDWHQAEKWLYKAAVQGNVNSQWALGMLYGIEIDGKWDPVKSYAWLEIVKIKKDDGAVSAQDEVRKCMTKEQIQEAENYARNLLLNEYVSS